MRSKYLYIGLFPILPLFGLSVIMTNAIEGPEDMILGAWEETSWRYEKMDHSDQSEINWMEEMDDLVKSEIGGHLIIHQSESWDFSSDRTLKLKGQENESKTIFWTLKGRGHILEMRESDGTTESYSIQQLSRDRMILHFNSDLQVRGIVEMEFRKKTN